MLNFFEILAQRKNDGQQWVTLLIFIAIVAFNIIGGLIKNASLSKDKKKTGTSSKPSDSKRYKPIEQWDRQKGRYDSLKAPKPLQMQSPEGKPVEDSHGSGVLTDEMKRLIDARKQQVLKQDAAYQLKLNQRLQQQQKEARIRELKVNKQQQILKQRQAQMLAMRKNASKQPIQLEVEQTQPQSDLNLTFYSASQLRDAIVMREILGKPLALREDW